MPTLAREQIDIWWGSQEDCSVGCEGNALYCTYFLYTHIRIYHKKILVWDVKVTYLLHRTNYTCSTLDIRRSWMEYVFRVHSRLNLDIIFCTSNLIK